MIKLFIHIAMEYTPARVMFLPGLFGESRAKPGRFPACRPGQV
jgi:hypothetical protein